jgi:hypothetical protein
VRYVLEGSVQRSGRRVRVSARLIDDETDVHLWADRLAGDTGDLFALQDDIARRIAVTLNVELDGAEANPVRSMQVTQAIFLILIALDVARQLAE